MAAIVPVVIAGLFLFTACLSWYTFWMLRFAIGYNLYESSFLMSMKENFNLQSSNRPRMMGIRLNFNTLNHWNKTQVTLKCCGLNSYTDWTTIERDVVPDSCCKIHETGCGKNFLLENIYQRGCERKLTEHIKQQYIIQTRVEQIFYWVVSIVFLSSATLITFFSIKTCIRNNNIENGYLLVSDDKCWSDNSVEKHVTFSEDDQDKFVIEIAINRKQ